MVYPARISFQKSGFEKGKIGKTDCWEKKAEMINSQQTCTTKNKTVKEILYTERK